MHIYAEDTDCISAGEEDFPNECPVYDIKQSDGEVPVMLELYYHHSRVHSDPVW